MNVSVFGKTIENVRKRVNTKIVRSDKKREDSQTDSESSIHRAPVVFQPSCRFQNAQGVCETEQTCFFFIYDFYFNHLKSGSTVLNESFSIPTQRTFCLRYRPKTWKIKNTCTTHVITPKSPPP